MTTTHHSHPSHPKPRRCPRSYTPLADALAQPLVFSDTKLSEGSQRHGLVGLLRAALSRQRRSDGEPLPNVLCALRAWSMAARYWRQFEPILDRMQLEQPHPQSLCSCSIWHEAHRRLLQHPGVGQSIGW